MTDPILAPARAITIRRREYGFFVSPGTFRIEVAMDDTPRFRLRNRASTEARVTFPRGAVRDEHDQPINAPFTIADGAANDRRLTVDLACAPEFFEYTVEITAVGIEAAGNSRPGVEIVP
jgi:hypothetical protein